MLHTHNPKPGLYGRVLGPPRRACPSSCTPPTASTRRPTIGSPSALVVYGLEAVASRFSHVELVQNPEDLELMRRLPDRPASQAPAARQRRRPAAVPARRRLTTSIACPSRARLRPPTTWSSGLVARLVAEKGVPELVDAVERLGAPFRLLLIGPARPREGRRAWAPTLLERATHGGAVLTGHRDDVDRLYAAMDVFCLPSHREGFPRAAMEAAASGLPVVATDIRGCRQVVEPGRTGASSRLGTPRRSRRAWRRMRTSPRRVEHGTAARAKAERDFDERKVVLARSAAYAS